ncbi:hypothetical protein PsYK624_123290 [Phanerochaete sordida]|uniref:Uncharacterized protein n=1 Tax=Phanerochaete sordida TaxID=48140 RepID=A0A9P3GJW8_9APHY|nr:hypothetical protein PsYK624_123290 [Phanerochaete sordida]
MPINPDLGRSVIASDAPAAGALPRQRGPRRSHACDGWGTRRAAAGLGSGACVILVNKRGTERPGHRGARARARAAVTRAFAWPAPPSDSLVRSNASVS